MSLGTKQALDVYYLVSAHHMWEGKSLTPVRGLVLGQPHSLRGDTRCHTGHPEWEGPHMREDSCQGGPHRVSAGETACQQTQVL